MRKALFTALALSVFSVGMTATATADTITFTSSSPHHDAVNERGVSRLGAS